MTTELTVEQCDRMAAAEACEITGWKGVATRLRKGVVFPSDEPEEKLVHLFARHRTEALAASDKGEIEAIREAENPCAKIFDHKWLDPECVEIGCQSLLPRRLTDEIDVMQPPDGFDAHTPSYNAGFARARKTAVDMLRQALSLPKGEMGS